MAMSAGHAFFPKGLKLTRLLSSLEHLEHRLDWSPTRPPAPQQLKKADPIRPVGAPLHKCCTSPSLHRSSASPPARTQTTRAAEKAVHTSPPSNQQPASPPSNSRRSSLGRTPQYSSQDRSHSLASQSLDTEDSGLLRSSTAIINDAPPAWQPGPTPPPRTPSSRAAKDAPRDAPSNPATPAAPLKAGLVQMLHSRRRPDAKGGGANKRNNGPQTSGTYRFLDALSKMRSAKPPACGVHDVLLSRLKGPEPELPGAYTFLQDYAFPGDGSKGLAALKLGESALALHNAVGIYEPLLKRLVGPEPRIPDQYAFLASYSFPGGNRNGDEQEDNCNGYGDINSIGNSNEEEEEEQEEDNMSKDNDDNNNNNNRHNEDDDNCDNSGRSSNINNNQFGLRTRQQCQPTGLLDILQANCQEEVGNDPTVNVAEYGSSEECSDEEPCIISRGPSETSKSQLMKYKLQSLIAESKTKQADCTESGQTPPSAPTKRYFKGTLNAKRSKPLPFKARGNHPARHLHELARGHTQIMALDTGNTTRYPTSLHGTRPPPPTAQ